MTEEQRDTELYRLQGLRDAAPGYYPADYNTRAHMLQRGLIAVDTNVLLDLYRFTRTTTDELLDVLGLFGDRLFVPHQVALEHERNRLRVVEDQSKFFKDTGEQLGKALTSAVNRANQVQSHCGIRDTGLQESVQFLIEAHKQLLAVIDALREEYVSASKVLQQDEVRARLQVLLDGKVGRLPALSSGNSGRRRRPSGTRAGSRRASQTATRTRRSVAGTISSGYNSWTRRSVGDYPSFWCPTRTSQTGFGGRRRDSSQVRILR